MNRISQANPRLKQGVLVIALLSVAIILHLSNIILISNWYWAYIMIGVFGGLLIERTPQTAAKIVLLLGILFTFIGISFALYGFDVLNIDASVVTLLGGLKTAFYSSVLGMTLATITRICIETAAEQVDSKDRTDWPKRFNASFEHLHALVEKTDELDKTVRAIGDQSVLSNQQLQNLLKQVEQSTEALVQTREVSDVDRPLSPLFELIHHQKSAYERLDEMNTRAALQATSWQEYLAEQSREATKQMTEAMANIIEKLEQTIREQLGESFTSFRGTITELDGMMGSYREQLTADTENRAAVAESVEQISSSVQSLTPALESYNGVMNTLQDTLEQTTEHQERSREVIAELSESTALLQDSTHALLEANREWMALAEQSGSMQQAIKGFLATSESAFTDHIGILQNSSEQFSQTITAQGKLSAEQHGQQLNHMKELLSASQDAHDAHIETFRTEVHESLEAYADGIARQTEPFMKSLRTASESVERAAQLPETMINRADELFDAMARRTASMIQKELRNLSDQMEAQGQQGGVAMGKALALVTEKVADDYGNFMEQLRSFNKMIEKEIAETKRRLERPASPSAATTPLSSRSRGNEERGNRQ